MHSQRLDALGRLAGGIANDLGNVLTTVRGFTQLVAAELAPDATAHADLRQVEQGVQRAGEPTRRLLTFARRKPGTPTTFAVNDALLKQERMLQRVLGEHHHAIAVRYADALHVRLDAGQFDQVVINLVLDARDATPGGGRLTLATRLVRPAPVDTLWCELEVADEGCRMTAEVRQHLFEPFFTTKPAGQGTGHGLAACYDIVGQAGGSIEVDSAPGRGSRFRVHLPAVAFLARPFGPLDLALAVRHLLGAASS